jgi:hypothetical protein
MSATLALMREFGAPLTREEYLKWNGLGKTYKPSPEEEAELPKRFQLPQTTHEEVAQQALDKAMGPKTPKPSPIPPRWDDLIKGMAATEKPANKMA